MKLDYFEIIRRAWEITWKYKFLWLFGFIIALAAGGSNVGNNLNYSMNGADSSTLGTNIGNFADAYLVLVLFIVAVFGLFGFIVWILSIISTGGLVGSAAKIERGEPTSLNDGFKTGAKNFWRILGLNIIVGLIILVLVLAVIVPLIAVIVVIASAGDQGGGMLAGMICFILIAVVALFAVALVAMVLSVVSIYAIRYIVLEGGGVFESFSNGWRLLKREFAATAIVFLLVWIISALAGLVFAVPGLIIGVPVFLALLAGITTQNIGVVGLAFVGFTLLSLFMAFLNGILEAYRSVVWTLAFMKIGNRGKAEPVLPPSPDKQK